MDINNATLIAFRKDFQAAMAALEEKYQCSVSLGTISYSGSQFHTKMEVSSLSADGSRVVGAAENQLAALVLKNAGLGNVPDSVIGHDVVLVNGKKGKLVKYDSKKRAYPLIVEIGGQSYKVGAHQVKQVI